MPEIHLRQSTSDNLQSTLDKPGFRYNSCGSFTKNKKKREKFLQKGDSRYIYQNHPDKSITWDGMENSDVEDLPRRIAMDKELCGKTLILPIIQNMIDIKGVLLQCFKIFS